MNTIFSNLILGLRNFSINNFNTNIIGIIYFDKNNYNINKSKSLILLSIIPYFITNYILELLKIDYLIERDNLIYFSKNIESGISPIISEFNIVRGNDIINFKEQYLKYGNNVPIEIIFKNEYINLENNDVIKVKYFQNGNFQEKSFNFKKIKLFYKIDLLK